jgi:integrase
VSISYDVRIWAIRVRKDRGKPYQVRWKVGNAPPSAKSFRTRGLADSFRSGLVQATRRGEGFDTETGLPKSELQSREAITWYEHALDYIDMKWPQAAGKSRVSAVETLTAVTLVLVRSDQGMPDPAILRVALRRWAFNPTHRNDPKPVDARAALAWIRRMSLPISALLDDKVIRRVLDVLAVKLDGMPAAPDYFGRRRRVLYNILKYAVREKRLSENPLDGTDWEPSDTAVQEISPRVVASPAQVRELLTAVSYVGPRRGERLVAFFACLYFAMLRPSEAIALRYDDCVLPETGWGRLELTQTTPIVGKQWTNTGDGYESRGLKNRPRRAIRTVPIPPELVSNLRRHIARYGLADDGRLFRSESGGVLYPSSYWYVWQQARPLGFPPAQAASLLARRPYDLRHAGVSLRLNAGVPATQVAEWAGHSVEILLKVYAKCIDGRDNVWFDRLDRALDGNGS